MCAKLPLQKLQLNLLNENKWLCSHSRRLRGGQSPAVFAPVLTAAAVRTQESPKCLRHNGGAELHKACSKMKMDNRVCPFSGYS
eukprot:3859614-Pleurochrysis_carterae.AAC.4